MAGTPRRGKCLLSVSVCRTNFSTSRPTLGFKSAAVAGRPNGRRSFLPSFVRSFIRFGFIFVRGSGLPPRTGEHRMAGRAHRGGRHLPRAIHFSIFVLSST